MFLSLVTVAACPDRIVYRSEFKTGEMVVARIEYFRNQRSRLPEDLQEIGIVSDSIGVFYRKESKDRYIVWFGTTLGESITYDSATKKWE